VHWKHHIDACHIYHVDLYRVKYAARLSSTGGHEDAGAELEYADQSSLKAHQGNVSAKERRNTKAIWSSTTLTGRCAGRREVGGYQDVDVEGTARTASPSAAGGVLGLVRVSGLTPAERKC
jgi:hypothetical protein